MQDISERMFLRLKTEFLCLRVFRQLMGMALFLPQQVFTDNEVRPGEKRISSMLFDPKHDRLITGEDGDTVHVLFVLAFTQFFPLWPGTRGAIVPV